MTDLELSVNSDMYSLPNMVAPKQKFSINPLPVVDALNRIQQVKTQGLNLPSSQIQPAVSIQRIPVDSSTQIVRAQFFTNPADPNFQPVSVFTQNGFRTVRLQAIGNKSPIVFGASPAVVPNGFIASQVGSSGVPETTTVGGGVGRIGGGRNRADQI